MSASRIYYDIYINFPHLRHLHQILDYVLLEPIGPRQVRVSVHLFDTSAVIVPSHEEICG
jgi:hypothetical protein